LIPILLSAAATCVVSLFLGQAALRLAGAREWSWLAPPVGISIAMLIAVPAIHVPGGCATVAVLLGGLTTASIVWCAPRFAHRPPIAELLAATPVMLLVLVPFLAAGQAGILGVGLSNDMAPHMRIAEGYLAGSIATVGPPDYPVGPHAMVALIAEGFGIRIDQAFAGWTMALPVLTAWTAISLVRQRRWLEQVVTATVVGMPFLVAAYYGQGTFKEVLLACLVLATALFFSDCGPKLGLGRWVPLALLVGGILSVYSVAGLAWPVVFGASWLIAVGALRIRRQGTAGLKALLVGEVPALGIALAVLVGSIVPQLPRIWRFVSLDQAASIAKDDIGNLVGPLPGWEAFGVWNNPDFRLPASPAFGVWTAFAVVLVMFGVFWAVRRGRWMLPLAAAGAMLIWAVSSQSQSPYVVAKALVVTSPLLLAVAAVALVDQVPARLPRSTRAFFRAAPDKFLPWGVAAILALALLLRVGVSDVQALRASPVGPTTHGDELRSLRPLLHDQPTLFLGNDDFIRWELTGVPVQAPMISAPELPTRSKKDWEYGQALDFDSVDAATINSFDWVVTTRDAAGSAPPVGLRLARTTPSFALWKRQRRVAERSTLSEGEMAGAVLDCKTPAGRAILRRRGAASVRPQPIVTPGFGINPDETASAQLALPPGRWQLESSYTSRFPLTVSGPGLRAHIPANLDRPGPRWPIGRLTVRGHDPTTIDVTVDGPPITPVNAVAALPTIVATSLVSERVVPVQRACGKYVDWYQSGHR
jgi:hypothetical protein